MRKLFFGALDATFGSHENFLFEASDGIFMVKRTLILSYRMPLFQLNDELFELVPIDHVSRSRSQDHNLSSVAIRNIPLLTVQCNILCFFPSSSIDIQE